jgi:vitamin-K-epoxide reductase (warfarin-sensitive)
MFITLAFVALLGFLISLYSFFIEQKFKQDSTYKVWCDISDKISCSKPIMGNYSNLFFISNALAGMGFYGFIIVLALLNQVYPIFYLSLAAGAVTIYLAYILFIKIKSLCLLCTAIYFINCILLVLSYTQLS